MGKIVRLTETDLVKIVKRVIQEQANENPFENLFGTMVNAFSKPAFEAAIAGCNAMVPAMNQAKTIADPTLKKIIGAITNNVIDETILELILSLTKPEQICAVMSSFKQKYGDNTYEELKKLFESFGFNLSDVIKILTGMNSQVKY